jgi:hypothetical protein
VGRTTCAALAFASLLALAGCGAGDGDASSTAARTMPAEQHPAGAAGTANAHAAARAMGREACEGMTPLEAARRYESAARNAGVTKRFAKLVTEPAPEVEASSGYPRLAAALYATITPEKGRAQAAAGCAEELAVDGEDGEVSSERARQIAPPGQGGAVQKGSN